MKLLSHKFSLQHFSNVWSALTKCYSSAAYDVIVVGGGHAGTEACAAASRMGARTLLVTHKKETIGEMSCNPSFGGVGKGHLMKEVDALDGVCGRICDKSGIHYKILNRSKGPAVWGPRAQIDRKLYKKNLQEELFNNTSNLTIKVAAVEDLILDDSCRACLGIVTSTGEKIHSKTVVLTTGTFLNGMLNIGLSTRPGGRIGDASTVALAETIKKLNFRTGRLKTGTPPRLKKSSINFDGCLVQEPDIEPIPFSFLNDSVWIKPECQLPSYQTITNENVKKVVLDNLHVNRHVKEEITGPRYCPSIESKFLRFQRVEHVIWLEPEGLDSDIIYPGGMSCTLPEEKQVELVHLIKALEKAEIVQFGYGVEYDFIDPRELNQTLETIRLQNLFFAGQINGTTGYEEAAAQGIIAGINAAGKCQNRPDFTISRTEGYIGVLIDDLTTLGTNEPYRMFTSRSEFRLTLRPDNADLRLTEKGYNIGCVSWHRYQRMKKVEEDMKINKHLLESYKLPLATWQSKLNQPVFPNKDKKNGFEALHLLRDLPVSQICSADPEYFKPLLQVPHIHHRLKIESLYALAIEDQMCAIQEVRKDEALKIPPGLNFCDNKFNFSVEEQEKLTLAQPQTIAAASRIPGITPSGIFRLLRFVKQEAGVK